MRRRLAAGAALALAAVAAAPASAAVRPVPVARFVEPLNLAAPPGDARRVAVVERAGRIRLIRDGRGVGRPFADLRGLVAIRSRRVEQDQGGLLSLAFAPDYARSGRLYVLYTSRDDRIRLDELRRSSADRAGLRGRRTVLSLPRPSDVDLAGHIAFGPDRLLYVGLGFGDRPQNSADPSSPFGKLLRIDPRAAGPRPYSIPPGNPFAPGRSGGMREVFALGLRVPWRFGFDRGSLVIGDVGDDAVEEVSLVTLRSAAGANFGYPFFEGDQEMRPGAPPGAIRPVLTRRHSDGFCALIAGPVVRDRRLTSLHGRFVYGDLCSGRIRSARLALPLATGDRAEPWRIPSLTAFGVDGRGRVHAVSLDGAVYRLSP